MNRFCIITPCFAPYELCEASVKNILKYSTLPFIDHWILVNHWPLEESKKYYNLKDYGCYIHDSGYDRGLHSSLNYWLDGPGRNYDYMTGFDPDTSIYNKGFDKAFYAVMTSARDISILAAYGVGIELNPNKLDSIQVINEYNVSFLKSGILEMWNLACYNLNHIREIGGFSQPNKYYGGIEVSMGHKLMNKGYKIGYLMDYKERYDDYQDIIEKYNKEFKLYRQWKDDHLSGNTKSFGEWLVG